MSEKTDVLNRDFLAARAALLEVAAFLDRLERAEGEDDFRGSSLRAVLPLLMDGGASRARRILESLSYSGEEPMGNVQGGVACGAPVFNS